MPSIYAESIAELQPRIVTDVSQLAEFLFEFAYLVEIDGYDQVTRRDLAAYEAAQIFCSRRHGDGVNAWQLITTAA